MQPPKWPLLSLSLSKPRPTTTPVHHPSPPIKPSTHQSAFMAATHLESCTSPSQLAQLHAHMLRSRLLLSPFHWNSLLRSYLRLAPSPLPTLHLFLSMLRSHSLPDRYSLPIAIKAAARLFSLPFPAQLHCLSLKLNLSSHEFSESGLISLYLKTGDHDSARKLFDENPHPPLGSWNAAISGLSQSGRSLDAVLLFSNLLRSGIAPDDFTVLSAASACGSLGNLAVAEQVHKCVVQVKFEKRLGVIVSNAVVDMYCKCGRTDLAIREFERMAERDVSTWTAMIMGMATHGEAVRAVEFFGRMRREGVWPNGVTFVAVLCACAHGGLVEEGMGILEAMEGEYGVVPREVHYGCVVDMLGRVGRVEEARGLVEEKGLEWNVVVMGTLLGACEKFRRVEIGEWVAGRLAELEPWNDGVYVVLSNIYAAAGMWREVERVRKLMRERKVEKFPGCSSAAIGS